MLVVAKKRLRKKITDKLRQSNRHELKRIIEAILTARMKVERAYERKIQEKELRISELENQVEFLISKLPFWKREKVRRELLNIESQEVASNG